MRPFLKFTVPLLTVLAVLGVSGGVAFANAFGQGRGPATSGAQTAANQPAECPMYGATPTERGFGPRAQGAGLGPQYPGAGVGAKQNANAPRGVMGDVLETLKMDPQTFVMERQSGQSLAEIAKKQGVSEQQLIDAWKTQLSERIDLAVQSGRVTPEQAKTLKAGLDGRLKIMVEQSGTLGGMRGAMQGWWLQQTTS